VTYKEPIGGGYYISITSDFWCIDIIKWFLPHGENDIKPTHSGLALRLREWRVMKQIVEAINNKYAALGTALPCYVQDDHLNQLGSLHCREGATENAGLENAGLENAAPDCRGGKCGSSTVWKAEVSVI